MTLHITQKTITGYLGSVEVFSFERKYFKDIEDKYVIDYRDIIHSLAKKPRAFRACKYKDQIFPNNDYRKIWSYLDETESSDVACKKITRILKLSVINRDI